MNFEATPRDQYDLVIKLTEAEALELLKEIKHRGPFFKDGIVVEIEASLRGFFHDNGE